MDAKKIFVGSLILSSIFINFSPALADDEDVEIFGSEFEEVEDNPAPTNQRQDVEETQPPQTESQTETAEHEQNIPPEISEPEQPSSQNIPPEISEPEQPSSQNIPVTFDDDDEDLDDELNFDDLTKPRPETPSTETVQSPEPTAKVDPPTEVLPPINPEPENTNPPTQKSILPPPSYPTEKADSETEENNQKKLKTLKARFIKLTMDQNYIYYLDKETVTWRKMPYSTTEMMADVWIRMIERDDTEILRENEVDDIIFAAEQGKQFRPEDVEVLRHQKYHLEHYYLRPKTQQIQYLVELSDIEGNPQNTINERTYSYANWENLVPNSVEYRIYHSVIKIIGKGKSSSDAPSSLTDKLEEYFRISIR